MDAHIFYSILPHRCQVSVGTIAAHITTTRYTSVLPHLYLRFTSSKEQLKVYETEKEVRRQSYVKTSQKTNYKQKDYMTESYRNATEKTHLMRKQYGNTLLHSCLIKTKTKEMKQKTP